MKHPRKTPLKKEVCLVSWQQLLFQWPGCFGVGQKNTMGVEHDHGERSPSRDRIKSESKQEETGRF